MPKNVIIAAALPAPPEKLWEMYLDPAQHAAFTGHPVKIEARAGAVFQAFEGRIGGTILHVEPKRMIVQTWRSVNFRPEAIDSILILTFWPDPVGGRIELAHVNIDDQDFAGISHGWEKHYWTPWRSYLERG